MLSDAVAAFLESVSERAFDQPFLALLRSEKFKKAHFTHGQREFGKDFIGQRDGQQWVWQSKAGDIDQGDWRDLRGQLDELRLTNLGHGAFDARLPRRPVLVTTGRLVGNAPDLFRDYNEVARSKGEPEVELWDRDILLGLLADNTDAVLRGSVDGQLFLAIGSADHATATMKSVEHFSRRWMTWEPDRIAGLGVVEAGIVCERFATSGRLDLACHLSLCLIRGAIACQAHESVVTGAGDMFETYARKLLDSLGDEPTSDELIVESGASAWISYPVRCLRIAEIVGLLALRLRRTDPDRAGEVQRWLARFVEAQPGTSHPIGDEYAVGLAPIVLAMDRDPAEAALREVTIWLCDHYERGRLGLAGLAASPREEVERLLGWRLESVDLERRSDSYVATVLLDLAIARGFDGLYADMRNDIAAVEARPRVLRLVTGPDQFDRTGLGNSLDPSVDFAWTLEEDPPLAPHHTDEAGSDLCEAGMDWELMAISSAMRDRHFVRAFYVFSGRGGTVGTA